MLFFSGYLVLYVVMFTKKLISVSKMRDEKIQRQRKNKIEDKMEYFSAFEQVFSVLGLHFQICGHLSDSKSNYRGIRSKYPPIVKRDIVYRISDV